MRSTDCSVISKGALTKKAWKFLGNPWIFLGKFPRNPRNPGIFKSLEKEQKSKDFLDIFQEIQENLDFMKVYFCSVISKDFHQLPSFPRKSLDIIEQNYTFMKSKFSWISWNMSKKSLDFCSFSELLKVLGFL